MGSMQPLDIALSKRPGGPWCAFKLALVGLYRVDTFFAKLLTSNDVVDSLFYLGCIIVIFLGSPYFWRGICCQWCPQEDL